MYGSYKQGKKEDEFGSGNPYQYSDKTSAIQEARVFNETPVNVKKSTHVLTKILYLLNQGETFAAKEATDVFFAMTKLFQSNDIILRRLVYLGIKELCGVAEDTIIVTSSLTKDMTGREDQYRASAIRALCRITDATMLQAVERYMKQAMVDRNAGVSSAALVSCRHIAQHSPDVVKRWLAEVQEATQSDHVMVQFHGLGVLHQIRQSDKLAVTKMVSKLISSGLRSPYAICLLIRVVGRLVEDQDSSIGEGRLMDFLKSMLRHKSEIVVYEAANAIVSMSNSSSRDLAAAVSVLQLFLSSPKATLRFAAVRTLNKVAMIQPTAVTACNLDLENLVTDVNRSIATLAITTLLKTGSESSIDSLMRSISNFLNDITDEFKVVVVEALRSLALQYPRKQTILMGQLADMLRSEGGLAYKEAIASTIITIIEDNTETKEKGLDHLCEFIEDCEHTTLAVRILHLLGKEGPRTQRPARYIRFIYNRVILENAAVRAASVSVLARFGALCPTLLPNILVLLQRCMLDTEDEVRDRATYYHCLLSTSDDELVSKCVLHPPMYSLHSMERALVTFLAGDTSVAFDAGVVPSQAIIPTVTSEDLMERPDQTQAKKADQSAEKLTQMGQKLDLGPIFCSSAPLPLTESETEYVVTCVKHTYKEHILFQFDIINTLNDQLLENVSIQLEETGDEPVWEISEEIKIASLPYDTPSTCYVLLVIPDDISVATGQFAATLKFQVRDCDPTTGEPDTMDDGFSDDYTLEDVEIMVSDHMAKSPLENFAQAWEELGAEQELEDTFAMSQDSLKAAVQEITNFLGMNPCDRSDRLTDGKSSHTLYVAGTYRGDNLVLARCKLALAAEGVAMQLCVRSAVPAITELLLSAVG